LPPGAVRSGLRLAALVAVVACASNPPISARDPAVFAEEPYIAAKAGGYWLTWVYGGTGCVLSPERELISGALQFSLRVTTSSGCIPGREGSMQITRREEIEALEKNGAFWLEPGGTRLKLEIRSQ
jgi:hypothetical protein